MYPETLVNINTGNKKLDLFYNKKYNKFHTFTSRCKFERHKNILIIGKYLESEKINKSNLNVSWLITDKKFIEFHDRVDYFFGFLNKKLIDRYSEDYCIEGDNFFFGKRARPPCYISESTLNNIVLKTIKDVSNIIKISENHRLLMDGKSISTVFSRNNYSESIKNSINQIVLLNITGSRDGFHKINELVPFKKNITDICLDFYKNHKWSQISPSITFFNNKTSEDKFNGYQLMSQILYSIETDKDIIIDSCVEKTFENAYNNFYKKPWLGIIRDIDCFTPNEYFNSSLENCLGIIVFSNYAKNKIKNIYENIYVAPFPLNQNFKKFSMDNFINNTESTITQIGDNIDNQSIERVEINPELFFNKASLKKEIPDVKKINRLTNDEYSTHLSKNIVFLNIEKNNRIITVLECIQSATPIIVNRLPIIEEFLGKDYPLFYNNFYQACLLSSNLKEIENANIYLEKLSISSKPKEFKDFIQTIIKDVQE